LLSDGIATSINKQVLSFLFLIIMSGLFTQTSLTVCIPWFHKTVILLLLLVLLFVVYLTTLFRNSDYTMSNEMVISERWSGKDFEGSGHGLILRYYPGIRLEGQRKTMKIYVRIAGVRAEIWTRDLPNTEC
jgi:hypothetical protein